MTEEAQRLAADRDRVARWKRWGPYLSERQWGTVREDYSAEGSAWDYFSHDQARSRAYRWGEDGILGISDNHQRLCFALALWNGNDPILKERLFGLTGNEGNHGEDVKEYYFYLDSTPTHSYMKGLYKYPQDEFPYGALREENQQRGRQGTEFELLDTGIFNENRYYDVVVEYAKATPEDILIRVSVTNRGPETRTLHLLPTLWFRNTWAWNPAAEKPYLKALSTSALADRGQFGIIQAWHPDLGQRWFYCDATRVTTEDTAKNTTEESFFLFTENETNFKRVFGGENPSPYVKDGIHRYAIQGERAAVNPEAVGTKVSPHYVLTLGAGETQTIRLRLCDTPPSPPVQGEGVGAVDPFGAAFDRLFQTRMAEADDFYRAIAPPSLSDDLRNIQRQAFAGMLWTKQYFHYVVEDWLKGDPGHPDPPTERKRGRNWEWAHLHNEDILSMPDKWEYPWFAAWDLAFHAIPLALVDPDFAKRQLDLMTREWYMHPNGQLPAYEWNFSDVNPPVHAWATWRVYQIERKMTGQGDRAFLERVFQKLLLNFTWWVNRKDIEGNNIFEGGFLGLDNIGVFDRSAPLPTGGHIEQADGTSWMGMYCLNMLTIALELAQDNPVYEDMATKFFEHFLYIAAAMNAIGEDETQLWDEEDGFFYDVLHMPHQGQLRLKVRSMVGLAPLFAVMTLEPEVLEKVPGFKRRLEWFIQHRSDLKRNVACMERQGTKARRMLALCYLTPHRFAPDDQFRRILAKLLDENEFLGEYGIRALSRYHAEHPYIFEVDGQEHRVDYEPAESSSGLFGGNSNWRGPVWLPMNYLLIESLQRFHHYVGDGFKVECPTGSGNWMTLWEVAGEISCRLMRIFLPDSEGRRAVYGATEIFQNDPHWRNLILFYEYFHGDNGAGIGASHQTGWTGLIAKLIQQSGELV